MGNMKNNILTESRYEQKELKMWRVYVTPLMDLI